VLQSLIELVLALQRDALALQGITKFNSLQINEMLYLTSQGYNCNLKLEFTELSETPEQARKLVKIV
jgi:hypothetical protein